MTVDRTDPGAGGTLGRPLLLAALAAAVLVVVLVVVLGLSSGGRVAAGGTTAPEVPDDAAATTTATRGLHLSTAAAEDAEALAVALAGVDEAARELDQTVSVARAHHAQVALPVRDLVVAYSEAFSQETTDALETVVQPSDDTDLARLAEARTVRLPYLSATTSTDHAAALEAHYRSLPEDELAQARTEVQDEVDRLVDVAQEHQDATLAIRAGVQAVDESIHAVLSVGHGTGTETARTLTHSSEEASAAFALALDRLAQLTAVELDDASWERRTLERPSLLGHVTDGVEPVEAVPVDPVVQVVETYLVTARDARASHELHSADPPADPPADPDPGTEPGGDPGDGGGSGGGGGYACYRWSPYGSYLGWCY